MKKKLGILLCKMRLFFTLICCSVLFISCVSTKAGYNLTKIQDDIHNYETVGEDLRISGTSCYHDFGNYKIKGTDVGSIYLKKYYNLNSSEKQKYRLAPDKALIFSDNYYTRIECEGLKYYERWIRNINFRFQELEAGRLILRLHISIRVNPKKNKYKEIKITSASSDVFILPVEHYGYESTFEITEYNISEIEQIFSDDNVYFEVDNTRTKFSEDECFFIRTYLRCLFLLLRSSSCIILIIYKITCIKC